MKALVLLFLAFSSSVMAAEIVVNTNDLTVFADDGWCTLSEAVEAANMNVTSGSTPGECDAGDAYPATDEISFDLGFLPADFFPFAPFELIEPVSIKGPGADVMSFSSIANSRVFIVQNLHNQVAFEISGMSLAFNHLPASFGQYGGAMLVTLSSNSQLTLDRIKFLQNTAERGGGALGIIGGADSHVLIKNSTFEGNHTTDFNTTSPIGGGAIFIGANQSVEIENSSFYDNYNAHSSLAQPQSDAAGGAILVRSSQSLPTTLTIKNATFSNNHTTGVGGAIALGGPGFPSEWTTMNLAHSTLTLNQADSNDDQTGNISGGGGIWSSSPNPITMLNNIVSLNTDLSQMPAADLSGVITSLGYNLIGDNSTVSGVFPAGQPNANDDWVGAFFAVLDPMLTPLADHGGPTLTHQPLENSIVLDQGKCNNQTIDQRHFHNGQTGLRSQDIPTITNALSGCDIGAVELSTLSSNPLPVLSDDEYLLLEDVAFLVSADQGVLNNDSDNDPLVVLNAGTFNVTGGDVDGSLELATDGAFQFTSTAPDANGQSTFNYTVHDGFNATQASVTLTIQPVNDPPSFDALNNHLVSLTGQAHVITQWANNIAAGPPNESTQALAFLVSETQVPANFFNQLPTINSNGDLTLDLHPNASGVAEISVLLQDNGGTQFGGQNQSPPVTLTIEADDTIFMDGFE